MTLARAVRIIGRLLLVLQGGLVVFCAYHIVDAYTTPYTSEWLTATAFVPYLVLAILFYVVCMALTYLVVIARGHLKIVGEKGS